MDRGEKTAFAEIFKKKTIPVCSQYMITSIKASPRQSTQQLSTVEAYVNSFLRLLCNFRDDAPALEKYGFAPSIVHYSPEPCSQLSPPITDPPPGIRNVP